MKPFSTDITYTDGISIVKSFDTYEQACSHFFEELKWENTRWAYMLEAKKTIKCQEGDFEYIRTGE